MKNNIEFLRLENKKLIANYNVVNNNIFLQNFERSVCKLFSFEVDTPRILILNNLKNFKKNQKNIEKNLKKCLKIEKILEKVLKINHNVAVMNTCPFDDFCKIVHYCEFDLGLFFYYKTNFLEINFVSGSGKILSATKFSIIENQFKKKISTFGIKKVNVKKPFEKSIVSFQNKQQIDKLNNYKNLLNNL